MPEVKNLDILYASIFGGVMPIPQHMKADGTMVATGESNPLPIMSLGMLPIQFQETLRTQKLTQAQNAVTITNGTGVSSNYIDVSGFDRIAVTTLNSLNGSTTISLDWSHDGTALHASEQVLPAAAATSRTVEVPVKAQYVRIYSWNGHTAPLAVSSWLLAKS